MALPKLNDSPKYELVIPSSQQNVRYRPYLVKEEKVLMLAMESEDQAHILNTIADTIISCVEEPINRRSLTTFDIEYMFLQIRSKSVGESVDLKLKCESCDTPNDISIKLNEINIDIPNVEKRINITDEIAIELAWPVFSDILDKEIVDSTSTTEQTFKLLTKCIKAVETNDERILFAEEVEAEQMRFVESLNNNQFGQIKEFIDGMPALKHDVNFTCSNCQHNNELKLQGLNDFF